MQTSRDVALEAIDRIYQLLLEKESSAPKGKKAELRQKHQEEFVEWKAKLEESKDPEPFRARNPAIFCTQL